MKVYEEWNLDTQNRVKELHPMGRFGYALYCKVVGGKTYDGKPIPIWDDLADRTKAGWTMHAMGSLRFYGGLDDATSTKIIEIGGGVLNELS